MRIPSYIILLSGWMVICPAETDWSLAADPSSRANVPPRLEMALLQAARQHGQALADQAAAKTPQARLEAVFEAAHAKHWQEALQRASAAVTPRDSEALIVSWQGGVTLDRRGQSIPLTAGLFLEEGDGFLTAQDGLVEIRFYDGTSVVLGPGGELQALQVPRIGSSQGAFSLKRGNIHWDVPAISLGSYKVISPRAVTVVSPGACDVGVEAGGETLVRAYRGRVETVVQSDAAPVPSKRWWRGVPSP